MLRRYEFREQWNVDAPIDQVWPIIRDVSQYPTWWSQFVETKRRNDVDGVDAAAGRIGNPALLRGDRRHRKAPAQSPRPPVQTPVCLES
jgi:hypothetical protein